MTLLSIDELLDDPFFIEEVLFQIVDSGSDNYGNPVETITEASHANTNVQPATGSSLMRLPEGEREKPSMQVFTKRSFPIKNGDYMIYNDVKWRCMTEENWSKNGYYDGIFVRYNGAEDIDSETPNPFG